MSKAIVQLLRPEGVLLNCEFISAEEVIKAIGEKLFEAGYVKDSFVNAAIEREKTLPTGLPLGGDINAAIPHTEIEHVIKPALGMATLRNEVNFRNMVSPDEFVPVRLVFLLALEQPKAQIEMLQEVAGVLQNPKLVSGLLEKSSYKEIIDALENI
jgi:PTS system galactitol-specific IIA component